MQLADRGLNLQAEAIEDTQTLIRIAVRDGYLSAKTKAAINAEVQKIIGAALKRIRIPDLRNAAYRSLNAFAERQYSTYVRSFGISPVLLLALLTTADDTVSETVRTAAEAMVRRDFPQITYETEARGIPVQEYSKDYIEKRVAPVLDRLAEQKPLDPDDVSGRNSLRNRAEMEVRYAKHQDEIASLRAAGVKLVVASVHADCSKRCSDWQGRVYSLDGTRGTTEDGKTYVPLETATDVYYTTKAGKTYKNGLLGFNCRHYITEYKVGMVIPHVSAETQAKERAINTRQRELERRVLEWRTKALQSKGVPGEREIYLKARKKAIEWRREYEKFSRDNGRAYYPSRIKLI